MSTQCLALIAAAWVNKGCERIVCKVDTMRMREGAQRDCRHFERARTAAYSRSLC